MTLIPISGECSHNLQCTMWATRGGEGLGLQKQLKSLDYFDGREGRTSTLLIIVRAGMFKTETTMSAISSAAIIQSAAALRV